jgi:hypothetical protein
VVIVLLPTYQSYRREIAIRFHQQYSMLGLLQGSGGHMACVSGKANGDSYNALIHGLEAGNREITGYYAVTTDRLLSLLFAERT